MAYFDKKDIQNSFAKAVMDSTMDSWSFEGDEWQKCVMEINGICVLYEQIIADMKKEDDEAAKKYEALKQKEAEKTDGGE